MRHVKCGEEKPICIRCISLGASCNYAGLSKKVALPLKLQVLAPRPRIQEISSTFQIEIDEGYQYFELFRDKTSFQILSHTSDIQSLRLILLQAGVLESSIRHVIAALGALEKVSETTSNPVKVGRNDYLGEPERHYQNAIKLYSHAISQMQSAVSNGTQDYRTTLLTCLVNQCFEAWTGNQDLALQQMQIGIKLIQQWKVDTRNPPRDSSVIVTAVEADLVRAFDRLAIQVVCFTAPAARSPVCNVSLSRDGREILSHIPLNFTSLQEAGIYQSSVMRYGMHLITTLLSKPEPVPSGRIYPFNCNAEITEAVLAELNTLIVHIKQWYAAFHALSQSELANGGENMTIAATLKIHVYTVHLCLVGLLAADETVYDSYHEKLSEMVDLAEMIIKARSNESSRGHFAFDLGVIYSLQLPAQKCRDSRIRKRAVALLSENPRREGVWDSVFVGKMMEWAVDVEEEFMKDGYIPAWARIRGVAQSADMQRRRATLLCQQRISEDSDELIIRQKHICW
ncbi:hypothetical protein BP5796_05027 [Coleophoma crateriformis]|uniref:Zn(2)-C6 fungal-type domain-containing protein n=1 Tax=Coleophoma crateriformis TaxID=565419 RepID=A0A3D8S226_9HELO|nr:hypothetical protein BP5796_05027 [Coleophoma crateriformis]